MIDLIATVYIRHLIDIRMLGRCQEKSETAEWQPNLVYMKTPRLDTI